MEHLDNFLQERKKYRIRTTRAKKDSNDPVDDPLKKEDHLMDCWRYISMQNPRYEDRILRDYEREEINIYGIDAITERVRKRREQETVNEYLGTEW